MAFFALVALESVIRHDSKLTQFYASKALASQLVAYAAGRRSPFGAPERRAQAMLGKTLGNARAHQTGTEDLSIAASALHRALHSHRHPLRVRRSRH